MKIAFLTGFLLGVAGIVAAAIYYPWVGDARIPSLTSVVANGGRAEKFLVRLPADKIAAISNVESGPRLRRYPSEAAMPDDLTDELVMVEHFKVRDSQGDVIGIAARHTVEASERIETVWNIVIPGRGAMLLRGEAVASMLDRRLQDSGFRAGEQWVGDIRIPAADADRRIAGELLAGTGEFEGLKGRYGESWQLSGVTPGGDLRGTIQLSTVSSRSQ